MSLSTRILNTVCRHSLFRQKRFVNINHVRSMASGPLSSRAEPQTSEPASEATAKDDSSITHVQSQLPLENVPFAKNLFLGEFDKNIFVFPEISTNEELQELNELVAPVEKYFTQDLDSTSIDRNAKIPDDVMQQLKDLGLFGLQIPLEYGGLGLNATKYARLAEYTSADGAIAVCLAGHQAIGLKGILQVGTEEQKAKYLPKLASGEHVAAFALTEPSSGSDAASIRTRATLSEDGKHYLLNGGKIWITNGGIADVFTVFAKTPVLDEFGQSVEKITAFIVERAFGGVTNGAPEDKLGIRGSNTCEVYFENTPVPLENVLGEVGGGFKVAMNILNSGRFSMGSSSAGALKRLIGLVTEHASTREQFGKPLKDFGMIQEKIANMSVLVYAMESMAYLTAGILDGYQEPDASIEAAMVKVFSSEGVWYGINEGLQILGGLGYMKNYPYEQQLRDARILPIFEGTNEVLRLFIALTGMQHAGLSLREVVKKLANPFNNVSFLLKKHWERRGGGKNPKLRHGLAGAVHPTLSFCAEALEQRVLRFQMLVEYYLGEYKNDIVDEQIALRRFADIAIDFYAMTACMSRATRSLAIGLRNADHESLLCQTFCTKAIKRIEGNLEELAKDRHQNGDDELQKIAKTIFKNQGWVAEHPLTRNW